MKALAEANLLPQVISGSSAGSIVAVLAGVNTNEELLCMFEPGALQINLFDGDDSILSKFKRYFHYNISLLEGTMPST